MKKLIVAFLSSVLVYLLTCWTAKFSTFTVGWAESVSFYAFTILYLNKNASNNKEMLFITAAIILGRVVLEIPVRIQDFYGTIYSFYVLFLSIISIILAALCLHEKKIAVYALSTIIIVITNSVGHEIWRQLLET